MCLRDHQGNEGEGGVINVPGDLPAAFAGEVNPAGLESDIAVAVGDIGGRRRCGRVQASASDRKLPAYQPPPGKLPPDRAVRVDHVAICHDDAIHVQCDPQRLVAPDTHARRPERRRCSRRSHDLTDNRLRALPGGVARERLWMRWKRPARRMMVARMMRSSRVGSASRHDDDSYQTECELDAYPCRHRDDPLVRAYSNRISVTPGQTRPEVSPHRTSHILDTRPRPCLPSPCLPGC